jgi:hypothetical protein
MAGMRIAPVLTVGATPHIKSGGLAMSGRVYRVWLLIEEEDESSSYEGRLVEQVELASFLSVKEALTYRYELSQKYSPKVTGESEVLNQMASPDSFTAGD